MQFKDYYQTLGVTKSASDKEIKQAFRKLARKHHPDVNPGDKSAEARFKEINEAYEVLGDPDKRKKYDELGANWRMYEQAREQGQPWPGGSPFADGPQAAVEPVGLGADFITPREFGVIGGRRTRRGARQALEAAALVSARDRGIEQDVVGGFPVEREARGEGLPAFLAGDVIAVD